MKTDPERMTGEDEKEVQAQSHHRPRRNQKSEKEKLGGVKKKRRKL